MNSSKLHLLCCRGRSGAGGATAGRGATGYCIKISEAEIADDYPLPQQYRVRMLAPIIVTCFHEMFSKVQLELTGLPQITPGV